MGFICVGVDVGRSQISVCALSAIPANLKLCRKQQVLTLKANKAGIEALIALQGDLYVLEPTGGHYSRLWVSHLERAGLRIGWVSNWALKAYRKDQKLLNKSDYLDAIALAVYGLERHEQPHHWIGSQFSALKDLYYAHHHLSRVSTPISNRLRQHLEHEWPEMANKTFLQNEKPSGLIYYIAGQGSRQQKRWEAAAQNSIGLGLSDLSQRLASHLIGIQADRADLIDQIKIELMQPIYSPYVAACEAIGMTPGSTMGILVGTIYPFERFLGADRRPRDEYRTGQNGKRQRYRRSLQAFKLTCGMGMVQHQSGGVELWTKGGSETLRTALWAWVTAAIVVNRHRTLTNAYLESLREYYNSGQAGQRNQRQSRLVRRWLEALYRELVARLAAK